MKKKKIYPFIKSISKPWLLNNNQNTISYRFIKKFTGFCFNHLPRPLRKKISSLLYIISEITSRFLTTMNQLSYQAYIIKGKEKNSEENIKILYFTNEEIYPHLMKILFLGKPKHKKIGKVRIWSINKEIKKFYNKINAVFIETNTFFTGYFEKKGFIIIPESISMTLDISQPLKNIYKNFSKSGKEDIRKVKKYGYTYELTRDAEKLKLFYNEMYMPYITQRHEKTAIHTNFHALRLLFEKNSRLMLIKQKNEYVSGALFSIDKEKATATYLGIKKGKNNLLKKGLTAASYYFLIKWAKKHGVKTIDFGTSKAFINDGLFRYKKKWGTNIAKTNSYFYSVFPFKVCKNCKAIQSFLINNPFIYLEKNQLKTMPTKKE
jgi:hypothetical protein